jgi:hypothetical protein
MPALRHPVGRVEPAQDGGSVPRTVLSGIMYVGPGPPCLDPYTVHERSKRHDDRCDDPFPQAIDLEATAIA